MSTAIHLQYPRTSSHDVRREGGGHRGMAWLYLGLHLLALGVVWTGITWTQAILCLLLLQVRGFCVSAGYHRLLAHRSFKTSRLVRFLLAAGGCMSLRGGPLWWTALHRYHHRVSDTPADVFSPAKGFWWSYIGWLISGQFDHTDYSRVRDLASFPELSWLNRRWLHPPLLLALLTLILGGLEGFLTIFCLSSVLLLHSMAAIDALNHLLGRQRFDTGDESRNNFVLSLLANGEGWHNNHHHYPASARQGFYWWEVDSTYTFLKVMNWAGLVWDLKTPPQTILERRVLAMPESAPSHSKVAA